MFLDNVVDMPVGVQRLAVDVPVEVVDVGSEAVLGQGC